MRHGQIIIGVKQFQLTPEVTQSNVFSYLPAWMEHFSRILHRKGQLLPVGCERDVNKRRVTSFSGAMLESIFDKRNQQQRRKLQIAIFYHIMFTDSQAIVITQFFKRDIVGYNIEFLGKADKFTVGFIEHEPEDFGKP